MSPGRPVHLSEFLGSRCRRLEGHKSLQGGLSRNKVEIENGNKKHIERHQALARTQKQARLVRYSNPTILCGTGILKGGFGYPFIDRLLSSVSFSNLLALQHSRNRLVSDQLGAAPIRDNACDSVSAGSGI